MINFIGIGAQKSGTSWVYACLYEHPEICAPIKEIHFFSRDRFKEGKVWYESHFLKCETGKKKGEFSTSYLYSDVTAERIASLYPDTKIIAIIRNPIDRAISQYGNALKAGEIDGSVTFAMYAKEEVSVLAQGRYAEQLKRYYARFDASQILVLVYEDSIKDPDAFIESIYRFLKVDPTFRPSMLHRAVNISRVPKNITLERYMHYMAEFLRRKGLDRLVHGVRRLGLPDLVRSMNTREKKVPRPPIDRMAFIEYYKHDVQELSDMLKRDLMTEWNIRTP